MNQHVKPQLNRRAFVIGTATAGAGLALGLDIPFGGPTVVRAADGTPEVNAWVVIRPDDSVVIRIARSEMGQGTLTGLAQLVAEELECDWSKVTTEYPTPGQSVARKRAWGDFSTGGSRGIRGSQDYVRKGGATARVMLIQAAANEWKVPASECSASNSVITHAPSGKTTTYGKVVEAAAKLEPPADVKLKDPKDWKIAGKGLKRLDTADKTTGAMIYGIDVKLPGMLNAAIKDCPVFGGKLKSFDEAKVASMKGVKKVVRVGDSAVAVVADTWWHAKTALDALPIVWDEGDNAKVSSETISKWLAEGLDNAQPAYVGNKNGDALAAIASAAKKVEAVYNYPYQNHATMEPMNATALYTADKCEVWCGTQNGEAAFAAVLEASGLPADKCDVHKQMLGGGFGRRGMTDYVRQAVAVAKQMPGTPVKLLWSREEDMQHGKYHPITQCKLTGAFDADNNLIALHYRLSGQSILFSVRPDALQNGMDPAAFQGVAQSGEAAIGYSVPNLLVEHSMRNPHVPPGFWRGVNVNHNAIYMECFMDELALAAGQDPLEFRRKLMGRHPKNLAVLNAVADKIGWGKPAPQGVYRGIAQVMGYGSYVAGAAEISVTDGSKIKVHRIVASTDPGYAVNPAQIERQIAGSFVYGLSALFYGGCTVKDGRIEQTNFDSYNSMRINEMPKVESIIMPSGGFWGGVGEPTIGVAAPAVLNAYFAATGKRIRSVPLRDQNITFA
jgi:isoquinoline 1-oxidoreductase subunit beta